MHDLEHRLRDGLRLVVPPTSSAARARARSAAVAKVRRRRWVLRQALAIGGPVAAVGSVAVLLVLALPSGGPDTPGATAPVSTDALPAEYLATAAQQNGVVPSTARLTATTTDPQAGTVRDRAWLADALPGDRLLTCLIVQAAEADGPGYVFATSCDPPGTWPRAVGSMRPDTGPSVVLSAWFPTQVTQITLRGARFGSRTLPITNNVLLARVTDRRMPTEAVIQGPSGKRILPVMDIQPSSGASPPPAPRPTP